METNYYEKWTRLCKAAGACENKEELLNALAHNAECLLGFNSALFDHSSAMQMLMTDQKKQDSEDALNTAKAQAIDALREINKISVTVGEEPFSPIKDDGSNVTMITRDFVKDFFAHSK